MEQKRNTLDIVGFVLGLITILASIIVAVMFIYSTIQYWNNSDTDIVGFAYILLFIFACMPLIFVIFGVLEIVKFVTVKKSRKVGRILFFIQCGILAVGTLLNLVIQTMGIEGLLCILTPAIGCVIFGIARLKTTKNEQDFKTCETKEIDMPKIEVLQQINKEENDLQQARYCTYCGSKVDINNKFCGNCGKEILK